MEFFVVLICCAIAAALGFFIGATMRNLTVENCKLREPIKSEVQSSTVRNGTTEYVLRDGTEITFDWSDSWLPYSGLSDPVVTIQRGDATNISARPVILEKGSHHKNLSLIHN